MSIRRIRDFDIGSINTDLQPFDLAPNQITYGANFRCSDGGISAFGGHSDFGVHPALTDLGWLQYVETPTASYWIHAGTSKVYSFDGSAWVEISNPAGYALVTDHQLWSGCSLGGIPVINHPNSYPEYWSPQDPATSNFADLEFTSGVTWRSLAYHAKIIRSHRNFLIAFATTEGGTTYPDLIRWSDSADIGGLPPSWDETVTTNLAGTKALSGGGGAIVDALTLRNGVAIYQDGSTWQMDYVGGNFVWNFRKQNSTAGALALGCVAEIMGNHVILSDGDIVINDGTTMRSIVHRRIRRNLNSSIDVDNYANSFITVQRQRKEVWVCVPVAGSGVMYATRAYIWNWVDDTWSVRDLPDVSFMAFGAESSPARKWDDSPSPTWDTITGTWGERTFTPLNDVLMATRPDAATPNTVVIDPSEINDGDAFISTIEKTDLSLSPGESVDTITRVYPLISGSKPIMVYVGSQMYAGAPVSWKPGVSFMPGTDRKVDIRSTGQFHAIKITGDDFKLSGLDIEYVNDGQR